MVDIKLNIENLQKCICPECSVQSKSQCADEKLENMIEKELMQEKNISNPDEIPGLYCVTGKSKCKDFDSEQSCQCSGCDIWKKYELDKREPEEYYCVKSEAR
ncbi:DUF2769 domain-containing protein [Methanobacterium sp. ACI-7]|uniref:DUF2769 domain-containing protein n=1 Tax=unclassified Methanobacterium TaxID=2627676 RepID=UPI0039C4B74D